MINHNFFSNPGCNFNGRLSSLNEDRFKKLILVALVFCGDCEKQHSFLLLITLLFVKMHLFMVMRRWYIRVINMHALVVKTAGANEPGMPKIQFDL